MLALALSLLLTPEATWIFPGRDVQVKVRWEWASSPAGRFKHIRGEWITEKSVWDNERVIAWTVYRRYEDSLEFERVDGGRIVVYRKHVPDWPDGVNPVEFARVSE